MKRILRERILNVTVMFEIFLALFIMAGVLAGVYDLFTYIKEIITAGVTDSYEVFQNFLSHTLLLVVGVELVIMLILHTPAGIVEVLFFTIARKLLIESKSFFDVFMGIVAVAGLFAIRKYLVTKDFYPKADYLFPAEMLTGSVNEILDVNIPEELGNTMGEVVINLASRAGEMLERGKDFSVKGVRLQIAEMDQEKVKLVRVYISDKSW